MEGKVAIIGGSGKLGGWFANWFNDHQFSVILHGRNIGKLKDNASKSNAEFTTDLKEAVKDADYIMVSVPIAKTAEILKKCAEFAKKKSILFDVASVKGDIKHTIIKINEKYDISAVSIHPMFGPGAKGLKGKKIVYISPPDDIVVPKNEIIIKKIKTGLKKLENIFNSDKNDLPINIQSDFTEHDKIMGLVLGFTHFSNILFMNMLNKANIDIEKLSLFSGTTFTLQKIISESVIQEDPTIYAQIQMFNPEFKRFILEYEVLMRDYIELIKNDDIDAFKLLFKDLNSYAKKDIDYKEAYDKFYRCFENIK